MRKLTIVMFTLTCVVAGCDLIGTTVPGRVAIRYDFRLGAHNWTAGFAEYPAVDEADFNLDSGILTLPAELEPNGTGFFISGDNLSGDLFMFLTRQLTAFDGIQAGQTYRVRYRVVFASNAPSACLGAGGAPGESVILKAGASDTQPVAAENADGVVAVNIDKGDGALGGLDMHVLSSIANGISCAAAGLTTPYKGLERFTRVEELVTADSDGNVWLIVGTDSGFEGTTALYYMGIDVELMPVP